MEVEEPVCDIFATELLHALVLVYSPATSC